MKILILLTLFSISIFAQDSIRTNIISHAELMVIKSSAEQISANIKPKSIVELKLSREWNSVKNAFSKNFSKSSLINYKPKEPNFIDTDLFLVLVGSAVLLGATSAYFKLESDILYEKYNGTNNQQKLDKIDRYDLYSGLALGALQINFGYLIYKFLTD